MGELLILTGFVAVLAIGAAIDRWLQVRADRRSPDWLGENGSRWWR